MSSMASPTAWLEIDLDAIAHNISVIQKNIRPETRLMLVLKGDAYGHGITEVASVAASCGVDTFAVITLEEGMKIRQASVRGTILLLGTVELSGVFCETLLKEHLEPTVSSEEEARFLQKFCSDRNIVLPVHLKFDTGLSRLGVLWTEAIALAHTISESSHLCLASVYSHLAGYENDIVDRQIVRFHSVLDVIHSEGIFVPAVHLIKSVLLFRRPDLHFDQVRIGLALYGALIVDDDTSTELFRPAMSLKTKIVHIKTIPQGEGVSYSPQWIAPKETKVGVLGIGYANGVHRMFSEKIKAIIAGQLAPQIGLVTMNHLMVDLSSVPHVAVGDTATLLGTVGNIQITINELAEAINTNPREILCLLGNSNPRIFQSTL